jgi:hypothetical protein
VGAAIFSRHVQNTENSSLGCLHYLSYVGQTVSDCLNGPSGTGCLVNSLSSLPMEYSYCIYMTLNELMTFVTRELYCVNFSGPSTELCRGPYLQLMSDCFSPMQHDVDEPSMSWPSLRLSLKFQKWIGGISVACWVHECWKGMTGRVTAASSLIHCLLHSKHDSALQTNQFFHLFDQWWLHFHEHQTSVLTIGLRGVVDW